MATADNINIRNKQNLFSMVIVFVSKINKNMIPYKIVSLIPEKLTNKAPEDNSELSGQLHQGYLI